MKEDRVRGPKMAGIPARMENSGTLVSAPKYGNNMYPDDKTYMSKNEEDYRHDSAKIRGHMSRNCEV
jgi:hypothetical protein